MNIAVDQEKFFYVGRKMPMQNGVATKSLRRNDGSRCAFPTVLRNGYGIEIEGRCNATKEKKCIYCARIHVQFLRQVLKSGFDGIDSDKPLEIEFVTLTALGAKDLPWDLTKCNHVKTLKCSGAIGCKVDEFASAVWNDRVRQNWNWFVTELERELERELPYFKVFELQKRGVLHVHALIHVPGISHREFEAAVKRIAIKWDFGQEIEVERVTGRNRAGISHYGGKDVTKGSSEGVTVDRASGEVRKGGYRAWSASRDWGLSMGQAKALVRHKWIERAYERLFARVEEESARSAGTLETAGAEGALDYLYEKLRN